MRVLRNLGDLSEQEKALPGISLNAEGFSKLINQGFVVESGIKISITPEQLDQLTSGMIVLGKDFRMILQDIGYGLIMNIMSNSKNKWFL